MKRGKSGTADGIEQPNQEINGPIGEKKTSKHLANFESRHHQPSRDEGNKVINAWTVYPCKIFRAIFKKTTREKLRQMAVGWLVGFYGISTFVGYSMPNPIFGFGFFV